MPAPRGTSQCRGASFSSPKDFGRRRPGSLRMGCGFRSRSFARGVATGDRSSCGFRHALLDRGFAGGHLLGGFLRSADRLGAAGGRHAAAHNRRNRRSSYRSSYRSKTCDGARLQLLPGSPASRSSNRSRYCSSSRNCSCAGIAAGIAGRAGVAASVAAARLVEVGLQLVQAARACSSNRSKYRSSRHRNCRRNKRRWWGPTGPRLLRGPDQRPPARSSS